MASEIIEDTELKPDQSNIVKSGPITDSEYASFQITADASSVEGFDVFDDYAETMEKKFHWHMVLSELGHGVPYSGRRCLYLYIRI